MSKIQELKLELNEMRKKIRELKNKVREYQKSNGGCHPFKQWVELLSIQRNFRYSHIAYCLLRYKTMEQIEQPKKGNEPNMKYINQVIEKYTEIIPDEETKVA